MKKKIEHGNVSWSIVYYYSEMPDSFHNRTSLTDKLWEDEELWYTCTSETDGIAEWNNATQAMEGTPISEVKFKCNELGKYSLNVDTRSRHLTNFLFWIFS